MEQVQKKCNVYAPPFIEVYECKTSRFIAGSDQKLTGEHEEGDDNGIATAKRFEFSSPWDGLEEK